MGVHPEALGGALRRTAGIVDGTPIIVTENGVATADDEQRIEYTRRALASMTDAIHGGVDVRGYALEHGRQHEWAATRRHSASSPSTGTRCAYAEAVAALAGWSAATCLSRLPPGEQL